MLPSRQLHSVTVTRWSVILHSAVAYYADPLGRLGMALIMALTAAISEATQ